MPADDAIAETIARAAETVAPAWPLHSFVTANPLAGLEDRPFHEAVAEAGRRLGARGYPRPDLLRAALQEGRIDEDLLREEAAERGREADPGALLDRLGEADPPERDRHPAEDDVDRILAKWLAAFMDEGRVAWPMPNREDGFLPAFLQVARHDSDVPRRGTLAGVPDDPIEVVRNLLEDEPVGRWEAIFRHQFAALPGWVGLLQHRANDDGPWAREHPVSLEGFLAARLLLAERFDAPLAPAEEPPEEGGDDPPAEAAFLAAWERTYRGTLVERVTPEDGVDEDADGERPTAQVALCIDTRSEVLRRHVEAAGDVETVGYAGFFGVPMRWDGQEDEVPYGACPPPVEARHRVAETPRAGTPEAHRRSRWADLRETGRDLVAGLRSNAAAAFPYVETTGPFYGLGLAARTLVPGFVHDALEAVRERVPSPAEAYEPDLERRPDEDRDLPAGLPLDETVAIAAEAFELTGWDTFARLVAFVGHASRNENNPFEASLHCGACAGNPGGPNARVLAQICNHEAVRERLRDRGIPVPEDTVFVAGEHDTTTDEVTLFDGPVPGSHAGDLAELRRTLDEAQAGAAAERAGTLAGDGDPVRDARRRARDWAQTRPEWGLAGNAGFVVGPRDLTADLDLDGRVFLHDHDWRSDPDGDALEAILTGPMVVTQWINNQYYFASVDPAAFGGGSKVTQNPVGNVGVYQGNGGDVLTGLPLESLQAGPEDPQHLPLRLSTVVHAPVDRVSGILARHENLTQLLDNGWLSLTVVDPTRDHQALRYEEDLEWTPVSPEAATAAAEAPTPTTR
jgi:uncharacterized protein YbcC (UPF0753/DUF2309 family)